MTDGSLTKAAFVEEVSHGRRPPQEAGRDHRRHPVAQHRRGAAPRGEGRTLRRPPGPDGRRHDRAGADGRRALRRPAGVRSGGERGQPVQGGGGRDVWTDTLCEPADTLSRPRGAVLPVSWPLLILRLLSFSCCPPVVAGRRLPGVGGSCDALPATAETMNDGSRTKAAFIEEVAEVARLHEGAGGTRTRRAPHAAAVR